MLILSLEIEDICSMPQGTRLYKVCNAERMCLEDYIG